MSILLHALKKLAVKTKHSEPTTVSIFLVSVAIFLTNILVTHMGVMFMENSRKVDFTCRDKILGHEQSGKYSSTEEFKLALSYCGGR